MAVVDFKSGIVELDVLLDTRIATVARMNEEVAAKLLESCLPEADHNAKGNYHKRLDDHFEGVDYKEFMKLYSERDGETIAKATMTNAFVVIRHLIKKMLREEVHTHQHRNPCLYVNIYPYSMDADVLADVEAAISAQFDMLITVELVRMSPKELTPTWLQGHVRFAMMYEWNQWMNIHFGETVEEPVVIPEVTLYGPALFEEGMLGESEYKNIVSELSREIADDPQPFRAAEIMARELVHLQLVDARIFSIVTDFSQTAQTTMLPDL